jgi:hypothetical protein
MGRYSCMDRQEQERLSQCWEIIQMIFLSLLLHKTLRKAIPKSLLSEEVSDLDLSPLETRLH